MWDHIYRKRYLDLTMNVWELMNKLRSDKSRNICLVGISSVFAHAPASDFLLFY
jgi:hypothetical protein